MTTSAHSIPTETLLELVADPRRRAILNHLRESGDGAVTVEELTDAVGVQDAVSDNGTDQTTVSVTLHHVHLPKLADAGVIDYDERTETVRYRRNERIESLLQFVETNLE